MKNTAMFLKNVPEGFYTGVSELIYTISPDKVYMVRQIGMNKTNPMMKFFFRLPTKYNVYEAMITKDLYEGINRDISFNSDEIEERMKYDYLFGKDTVHVFVQYDKTRKKDIIIAMGPAENKEWQYEFQKYHL